MVQQHTSETHKHELSIALNRNWDVSVRFSVADYVRALFRQCQT
jgi:hypothetical protein